MILFTVLCALLIVSALACILAPLRHPDRIATTSTTTDANVAVYRSELAEMESDVRHRVMTNEQFVLDRDELEKRLCVDLPKEPRASGKDGRAFSSGMLIYVLAVGVPLTAILLYLALGTPLSLLQSP